jgi:hypothetical protein
MAPRPEAPRWGTKHNEALHQLFAERQANPERLENDNMDRIWEEAPEGSILCQVSIERFRHHYRDKSAQWLTEQALSGVRHSESLPEICCCSFPIIVSTNMLCCCHFIFVEDLQGEPKEEEETYEELESSDEDDIIAWKRVETMAPTKISTSTPKKAAPAAAAAKKKPAPSMGILA